MAGYADLPTVQGMVNVADGDTAALARLSSLNDALSAILENKVGRTWSTDAPVARTVAVQFGTGIQPFGPGAQWRNAYRSVLALPAPGIASLVSVTVGATWDGAAWSGGTAVDLADVQPIWQTRQGDYLGLAFGGPTWPWASGVWWGGVWAGVVLVEAVWADARQGVPADVVEALNFLVAEEYKQEHASPESLIGPDGLAVQTRNPWNFTRVAAVIEKYAATEALTL